MSTAKYLNDQTKLRLFDLLLFYFLPFLILYFGGYFLSNLIETFWLPSEKDLWPYTIAFYSLHTIRLILAVGIFTFYLRTGGAFLKKWNEPKDLVAGFGAGLLLAFFFFLLTQIQPGFTTIAGEGPLFILETLLFRQIPLFMVFGLIPHFVFGQQKSAWIVVLWSMILQVIWNLSFALWNWAQISTPLDPLTFFPSSAILLATALLHLRGVLTGVFVLIANITALGVALFFQKFPQPSLLNNVLTLLAAFFLVRMIQLGFSSGKKNHSSGKTVT